MSFESAIPVNRIAYGQDADFGLGSKSGGAQARQQPKQSVNISEDTLLRIARSKLHRMVDQRTSYRQTGILSQESPVGTLFSAKA